MLLDDLGAAAVLLELAPQAELIPQTILAAGERHPLHGLAMHVFARHGSPAARSEALLRRSSQREGSRAPARARPRSWSSALPRSWSCTDARSWSAVSSSARRSPSVRARSGVDTARWGCRRAARGRRDAHELVLEHLRSGDLNRSALLGDARWRSGATRAGRGPCCRASWRPPPWAAPRWRSSRRGVIGERRHWTRSRSATAGCITSGARWRARVASTWRFLTASRVFSQPVAGVALAVLIGGLAALVAIRGVDLPHGHAVAPGDALAALGLLVAAVVFAIELVGQLRTCRASSPGGSRCRPH